MACEGSEVGYSVGGVPKPSVPRFPVSTYSKSHFVSCSAADVSYPVASKPVLAPSNVPVSENLTGNWNSKFILSKPSSNNQTFMRFLQLILAVDTVSVASAPQIRYASPAKPISTTSKIHFLPSSVHAVSHAMANKPRCGPSNTPFRANVFGK